MKKIAIIAPNKNFWGASIVQIPFLRLLKQSFPDSEVVVWSRVKAAELFLQLKLVNRVEYAELNGFYSYYRSIKGFAPDLLINMRLYSSRIKILCALISAKKKISFSMQKTGNGVFRDTQKYLAYSYLDLLAPLNIKYSNKNASLSYLAKSSNFQFRYPKNVCLIVGAGEKFKRWGILNYLELAKALGPQYNVHFILGPDENEYIQPIQSLNRPNFHIHRARTVIDLAAMFEQSELVVSNDCGAVHIAQLVNCRLLSLWGGGEKPLFPRFSEWYRPRDNAFNLMADHGEPVASLSWRRVASVTKSLLLSQANSRNHNVIRSH